jgi:hypothetical protein
VTEAEINRQAAVLAAIADQLPWTTIEDWNASRFTLVVLDQEIRELRASFIIPDKTELN